MGLFARRGVDFELEMRIFVRKWLRLEIRSVAAAGWAGEKFCKVGRFETFGEMEVVAE
jgi:hypothetical protein